MSTHRLRFALNGNPTDVEVPAHRRLIDLLRDDLGLTGTKEGCSVGVCGACTVLVNGDMMSACLLPALFVEGASLTTIEGLAQPDGPLTPLQDAFIRHGGFQCGICTPGQLIAATSLLEQVPRPTEPEVKSWMMGNLCRCTGYYGIVDSIMAAAQANEQPSSEAR
ncbi:MAG: 2Fe-2S iron-sulfur cluster binding domain-containing protein [Chloroflexi bacterium]|nr:2Fe-2S iron-sulfur cluster binding domain-containing protein [Chloroflexota bacterium]